MILTWNYFQIIDVTHHIEIDKENEWRAWQINLTFNQQWQERYKEMKWQEKSTRSIIENKRKKKWKNTEKCLYWYFF